MCTSLPPYKFLPVFKPVLWGGEEIARYKGLSPMSQPIGESWELSAVPGMETTVQGGPDHGLTLTQLIARHGSRLLGQDVAHRFGQRFPLLIKFIDAHRDLSVQVHPDDAMARRLGYDNGKTEMWYVIHTRAGAKITAGFSRPITPDDYDRLVAGKRIMDVVAQYDSHPGDVFFIPPGQIHAIGAGNLVAEIQQTCDLTYRVYDYDRRDAQGNPRELHTQLARQALNYGVVNSLVNQPDGTQPLVRCRQFTVRKLASRGGARITMPVPAAMMIIMCVAGATRLTLDDGQHTTLRQGETVLIPATAGGIACSDEAQLLLITI